jgi:hypothetical protein
MSVNDRHYILQSRADEIREEIAGLQSGWIYPWGRTTKAKELAKSRRCLKHVYAVASEFGMSVDPVETNEGADFIKDGREPTAEQEFTDEADEHKESRQLRTPARNVGSAIKEG